MRAMTTDEARAFLRERPRTAKLATVRADGRPHIAPVWFALDGAQWGRAMSPDRGATAATASFRRR